MGVVLIGFHRGDLYKITPNSYFIQTLFTQHHETLFGLPLIKDSNWLLDNTASLPF